MKLIERAMNTRARQKSVKQDYSLDHLHMAMALARNIITPTQYYAAMKEEAEEMGTPFNKRFNPNWHQLAVLRWAIKGGLIK